MENIIPMFQPHQVSESGEPVTPASEGNSFPGGMRSDQFRQAVFNAIPEQIAVLNSEGMIIDGNSAWTENLNTPRSAVPFVKGSQNYLEICRAASSQKGQNSLRDLVEGVTAVLHGKIPEFFGEYRIQRPFHEDRWFYLTATPVGGGGAVLVHEDISQRKLLEREILEISEYERRRMGREMHDGLCQVLGGLMLTGAVLAASLRKREAPESSEMDYLVEMARTATAQARELSQGLNPVELDSQGLRSALHQLASKISEKIPCEFVSREDLSVPNEHTAVLLYRIAQEATANAMQHAEASKISIRLHKKRGHLVLSVEDDGKGMGEPSTGGPGMGMEIMKYRAGALGARLRMRSLPGQGTRVLCILPIT